MSLKISNNSDYTVKAEVIPQKTAKDEILCVFDNNNSLNETQNNKNKPEKFGEKSNAFRKRLIERYKDKYTIVEKTIYSYSLGKEVKMYFITAKKDVTLANLKKELGIRDGVIVANNGEDKYGKYGSVSKGHYIENAPMKGETFRIPVQELGYKIEERSFWERLKDGDLF